MNFGEIGENIGNEPDSLQQKRNLIDFFYNRFRKSNVQFNYDYDDWNVQFDSRKVVRFCNMKKKCCAEKNEVTND